MPGNWKTLHDTQQGFGWYRLLVDVPEEWKDRNLTLKLGLIHDCDETYFNGTKIGATGSMPPTPKEAYKTPRQYTVEAKHVRPGKANLIAVRVYEAGGPSGGHRRQHRRAHVRQGRPDPGRLLAVPSRRRPGVGPLAGRPEQSRGGPIRRRLSRDLCRTPGAT